MGALGHSLQWLEDMLTGISGADLDKRGRLMSQGSPISKVLDITRNRGRQS